MFRCRIALRRVEDVEVEFEKFQCRLSKSGSPEAVSSFLLEQVREVLLRFKERMILPGGNRVRVTQLLEGEGYSVSISICQGAHGFIGRLLSIFRG